MAAARWVLRCCALLLAAVRPEAVLYYRFTVLEMTSAPDLCGSYFMELGTLIPQDSGGALVTPTAVSSDVAFEGGQPPDAVFDTVPSSKWTAGNCRPTCQAPQPRLVFATTTAVATYRLVTANNACGGRAPASWTMEVSQDNVTFVNITSYTGFVTPTGGHTDYGQAFPAPTLPAPPSPPPPATPTPTATPTADPGLPHTPAADAFLGAAVAIALASLPAGFAGALDMQLLGMIGSLPCAPGSMRSLSSRMSFLSYPAQLLPPGVLPIVREVSTVALLLLLVGAHLGYTLHVRRKRHLSFQQAATTARFPGVSILIVVFFYQVLETPSTSAHTAE